MQSKAFILIQILCVLTFQNVIGQRGSGINIHDHLLIRDSNRSLYGAPPDSYEGSPYLNESFVSGIVFTGNQTFAALPMRYNIAEDVMEFQDRGQTFLLDAHPGITKIQIGDQTFVVDKIKTPGRGAYGYLELLITGKLSFLARKGVNYREKVIITDIPAKYSRIPDIFYFSIDGKPLEKLTSTRNLLQHLPAKREEAERFIKSEKLSIRDSDDLLKLAHFYNALFPLE